VAAAELLCAESFKARLLSEHNNVGDHALLLQIAQDVRELSQVDTLMGDVINRK